MALVEWRDPLPLRFERRGFGGQLPDGRRPPMAEGSPASGGLRFTNSPTRISGGFQADPNIYSFFRYRFFDEDLSRGRLPFLLRDQVLDGLRISASTGEIVTTDNDESITLVLKHRTKFDPASPPPSYTPLGGGWFDISFTLIQYN